MNRFAKGFIIVATFIAVPTTREAYGQLLPIRSEYIPETAAAETTMTKRIKISPQRLKGLGLEWIESLSDSATLALTIPKGEGTQKRSFLFPIRDSTTAAKYFGRANLAALQALNLSASTNKFSIYAEFASDYIVIGDIYVRMSLGGLISSTDSTHENDSTSGSIQRFFGAGGNALLQFAAPLCFYRGASGWGVDLVVSPKLAADLPAVNADVRKFSGSIDTGFEILLFVPSVANKFRLFFQTRIGWVAGSGDFYRNLGVNKPFGFGKVLLGIDINSALRVTAAKAYFGPKDILDNAPWQAGVQLIPG